MEQFITRQGASVIGVLSGFDRVRFRGTLRWLASVRGMMSFLSHVSVLLRDFKEYAESVTDRLTEAVQHLADQAQCPVIYVPSCNTDKERLVNRLIAGDPPRTGLLAVLSCVESCFTYTVHRSRERKMLELQGIKGRCLHYYFYLQHPKFGRCHVRLQSWFPFTVHICINGREWLAQQLNAHGMGYRERANTFVAVDDVPRAQALLDEQVRSDWPGILDELLQSVHPLHPEFLTQHPLPYYWSAEQTEWATDVMFRSSQELAQVYPSFVKHALQTFHSADILRFLGQHTTTTGRGHGNFDQEIVTDMLRRPEGVRVKHRLGRNSVKFYDKCLSVFRVETTINDPRSLKVYRTAEGDPDGQRQWRKLRKGVADIPRLTQLSQASNNRYLHALAATADTTPLAISASHVCQPVRKPSLRARALNPFATRDAQLLEAVAHGEFTITGFRNRDIHTLLLGEKPGHPRDARRQSNAITRQLRLLRAHGLIKKVPRTHRYLLTKSGQTIITALLTARQSDTTQLTKIAA